MGLTVIGGANTGGIAWAAGHKCPAVVGRIRIFQPHARHKGAGCRDCGAVAAIGQKTAAANHQLRAMWILRIRGGHGKTVKWLVAHTHVIYFNR